VTPSLHPPVALHKLNFVRQTSHLYDPTEVLDAATAVLRRNDLLPDVVVPAIQDTRINGKGDE
jgi:hypothetical protein